MNEKRRARDLPFELRPFPSATIADLDLDLFRRVYLPAAVAPEILGENQRSVEAQLASLRLLSSEPGGAPTAVGLLVLGKDPRRYLPGAYVQFLRIEGKELTDPIKDEEEIDGALPHLWPRLEDKFRAHLTVAIDPRTSPALSRPDYPLAALRQLALNALLHRSYESTNAPVRVYWFEDRIEIHSPGGPYGQVNRTNFGQPGITDYRNPHLAEAMKTLGYVQRFGVGIAIARQELECNGNPPLQFQVEDSHVLAIVRRRP